MAQPRRTHRRNAVALALALLTSVWIFAPAGEAAARRCDDSKRNRITAVGSVVVFERYSRARRDRVPFICSRRYGKNFVLPGGSWAERDDYRHVVARGDFAGFTHDYFDGGGEADFEFVESFNVRTGRNSSRATRRSRSGPPLPCVEGYNDECWTTYGAVAVTRAGSTVFSTCVQPVPTADTVPTCAVVKYEFDAKLTQRSETVLEITSSLIRRSLRIDGGRAVWGPPGNERSAPIE